MLEDSIDRVTLKSVRIFTCTYAFRLLGKYQYLIQDIAVQTKPIQFDLNSKTKTLKNIHSQPTSRYLVKLQRLREKGNPRSTIVNQDLTQHM